MENRHAKEGCRGGKAPHEFNHIHATKKRGLETQKGGNLHAHPVLQTMGPTIVLAEW